MCFKLKKKKNLFTHIISDKDKFLPLSLESLIQLDFDEYEQRKKAAEEETTTSTSVEEKTGDGIVTTTTTTTTTTKVETVVVNKTATAAANTATKVDHHLSSPDVVVPDKPAPVDASVETEPSIIGTITPAAPNIDTNTPPDSVSSISEGNARENAQQQQQQQQRYGEYNYGDTTETKKEEEKGKVIIPHDDSNSIYVGLRVYTHKDVPAVVVGRLKAKAKEVVTVKPENTTSSSSTS